MTEFRPVNRYAPPLLELPMAANGFPVILGYLNLPMVDESPDFRKKGGFVHNYVLTPLLPPHL
jgi:hypothetical protein